jgi:hypothetical protein
VEPVELDPAKPVGPIIMDEGPVILFEVNEPVGPVEPVFVYCPVGPIEPVITTPEPVGPVEPVILFPEGP